VIGRLKEIAAGRPAPVIPVQDDTGVEDEPAIVLQSKLGQRGDVPHGDIQVEGEP